MSNRNLPIIPATNPRIRVLAYEEYVEETKVALKQTLLEHKLWERSTIRQGERYEVRIEGEMDPFVIPIWLYIDALELFRNIGTAITLGRAIIDIIAYLRRRREERKILRFTVNCSSTYSLALSFLKEQGVGLGRPLYFRSFGWRCITIVSDINYNNIVHVVIYRNNGELEDYTVLTL